MSLIRIPLLISAWLGTHATLTPPHVATHPSVQKLPPTGLEKYVAPGFPVVAKVIFGLLTLADIAVVAALAHPSSPLAARVLATLVRNGGGSIPKIRLSTSFFLGWILNLAGTLIRLKCYRLLGHYFTFDLAIHKEHKLITSGPYALVRHPSYTGGFMAGVGMTLCLLGPGSWLLEGSGIIGPRGAAIVWLVSVPLNLAGLAIRTQNEDAMLRKQFGARWEEWARHVRYKMVPGVY